MCIRDRFNTMHHFQQSVSFTIIFIHQPHLISLKSHQVLQNSPWWSLQQTLFISFTKFNTLSNSLRCYMFQNSNPRYANRSKIQTLPQKHAHHLHHILLFKNDHLLYVFDLPSGNPKRIVRIRCFFFGPADLQLYLGILREMHPLTPFKLHTQQVKTFPRPAPSLRSNSARKIFFQYFLQNPDIFSSSSNILSLCLASQCRSASLFAYSSAVTRTPSSLSLIHI
eukprot:TRINITY_DN3319_c0_g1_i8.p1 TRINITY_DN3319_c0_g1~~TRINITY_DN3319_c0_g1_i8.p1  ORF type:complete len:224 (-),score=-29.97 TRINITY_DN3319_c0_g1_i8:71-742(-)